MKKKLEKFLKHFKRECKSCRLLKAEKEYFQKRIAHHMELERDARRDAEEKDFAIKRIRQKYDSEKQGYIKDIKKYLDPLPKDGTARKNVVAKIAGWFQTELGLQINNLISRMEKEISRFPLAERETDFYRAGINFAHLLLEWGDECIAEHQANIADKGKTESVFDKEDKAVENIKSKLKE